jgi:hypothetical protein
MITEANLVASPLDRIMQDEGILGVESCAGCQRLSNELRVLQRTVRDLQHQMGEVIYATRNMQSTSALSQAEVAQFPLGGELANSYTMLRGAEQQQHRQHVERQNNNDNDDTQSEISMGAVQDPGLREYFEELNKARKLKRESEDINGSGPGANLNPSEVKALSTRDALLRKDLETFEKRLLKAMVGLANRVATLEGDALRTVDEIVTMKKESRAVFESVVQTSDLKPKVLQILETTKRRSDEDIQNLYDLLQLQPHAVQTAVASRSSQQCLDLLLSTPAFKGLLDVAIKANERVQQVERETIWQAENKAINGATGTLRPFQRLLGMDLVEENDLRGLLVADVFTGGPAQSAGIRRGDRICKVNQNPVVTVQDFMDAMASVMPNSIVRLHRLPGGRSTAGGPEVVDVLASTTGFMTTSAPAVVAPPSNTSGLQPERVLSPQAALRQTLVSSPTTQTPYGQSPTYRPRNP